MRLVSTLHPPKEFRLEKRDRQSGFLGLYGGKYNGFAYELATSMFIHALFPWTRTIDMPTPKFLRPLVTAHIADKNMGKFIRSTLVKRIATKSFEFRVPYAVIHGATGVGETAVQSSVLRALIQKFSPAEFDKYSKQFIKLDGPIPSMSGKQLAAAMQTSARNKAIIQDAVLRVDFVNNGGTLTMWVTYTIPKAQAEFMNSSAFLEIKLGNFYQILLDWTYSIFGETGKAAEYSTPISKIAHSIKVPGLKVQSRTNADGIVVDQKGNYLWLPEINNAMKYEQMLQDYGLQPDGTYTMSPPETIGGAGEEDEEGGQRIRMNDPRRAILPKLPKNMPILIDWVNCKFCYSNSAGRLAVEELEFSVPLSAYHITRLLNTSIVQNDIPDSMGLPYNALVLSKKFQPLDEVPSVQEMGKEARDYYMEKKGRGLEEDLELAFTCIKSSLRTKGVDTEAIFHKKGGNDAFYLHQMQPNNPITEFWFLGRMFAKAYEALSNGLEAVYQQYSVITVCEVLAVLKVIVLYASKQVEVAAQDKKDRDIYINQSEDDKYKTEGLPLIKKDLGYLPHQLKTHNKLRLAPPFAIVAAAAGGGKTIIALTNILKELKDKHCKRPIVMCPAHLVADYVKEAVFVTEGRLNVIPLTNVSMKLHGEEYLLNLVDNAPPNTVCVTDYNFIKNKPEIVAYGNKAVTLFRNVEFLRKLEFDMVICDESHQLANSKSTRSKAVSRFISDVPMKRLMSGTFVSNTIKDIVAQFAMFDPTVFGDETRFNNEFGENVSKGGKVMNWKRSANGDTAEATIRKRMLEHCVYINCPRKEWAALLPQTDESFWGVELNPAQRELYELILKETEEKIQALIDKDPKIKEMMESEDENVAENLEAKLKPYMIRMERFLSSPGKDEAAEAFLKNPVDQVSPKIAKVYQLCKEHLDAKIPGKILIFTAYLDAAESVYDYAPPALKAQMIHYTAAAKMECRAEFETNKKMTIMVGQGDSMDTGINLQFCFPAQTPILVDYDKNMTIEDIYNTESVTHVLSYNLKEKRIEKKKILKRIRHEVTDTEEYVSIGVYDKESGKKSNLICTSNHIFFLKDGSEQEGGKLKVGQELIAYDLLDITVETVQILNREKSADTIGEYKYDLEIVGNHNYFACAVGDHLVPVLVHNCSRLIRLETVWTPGKLEQGNSRINRPEMKQEDKRTKIYLDTIAVNRSIDITKISRLISKVISKAKYDEFESPAYTNLPELPKVSMGLDSIRAHNDFNEELRPYLMGYQEYQNVIQADYDQYKKDNPGKIKPVPVPQAGLLPGSKLISRIPYVPGMEVYGDSQLGLVRYDKFLRQDLTVLETDEDDAEEESEEEDEVDPTSDQPLVDPVAEAKRQAHQAMRKRVREERARMRGRPVHTEFGDGEIGMLGPKRIHVRLADGRRVALSKLQVFMITRANTNGIDMRDALLKEVGKIPLDKPITVPHVIGAADKKRKKLADEGIKKESEKEKVEQVLHAAFDFIVINDFLAIKPRNIKNNIALVNALSNFGFNIAFQYWAARIVTAKGLFGLLVAWKKKGFTFNKKASALLEQVYQSFKANRTAIEQYGWATRTNLFNFYQRPFKATSDAHELNPFPIVIDGNLYLGLPVKGQPATLKAIRTNNIPYVQNWKHGGGDSVVIRFVKDKKEGKEVIKTLKTAGIVIDNLEELGQQWKTLKTRLIKK
jgi:hypothetical protein